MPYSVVLLYSVQYSEEEGGEDEDEEEEEEEEEDEEKQEEQECSVYSCTRTKNERAYICT